jgi:DNA-directed RNA polymerase specialized sigma24 family protein
MPEPAILTLDLIQRATDSDQRAIEEVVTCCQSQYVHLVESRLPTRLQSQLDPEDVLQEVWSALFMNCLKRHSFSKAEEFLAFLTRLTLNKLAKAVRLLHSQKRGVQRTELFSAELPEAGSSVNAMNLKEQRWVDAMALIPSKWHAAFELLRGGFDYDEVAISAGVHLRTIQRLVQEARERHATEEVEAGV